MSKTTGLNAKDMHVLVMGNFIVHRALMYVVGMGIKLTSH